MQENKQRKEEIQHLQCVSFDLTPQVRDENIHTHKRCGVCISHFGI